MTCWKALGIVRARPAIVQLQNKLRGHELSLLSTVSLVSCLQNLQERIWLLTVTVNFRMNYISSMAKIDCLRVFGALKGDDIATACRRKIYDIAFWGL